MTAQEFFELVIKDKDLLRTRFINASEVYRLHAINYGLFLDNQETLGRLKKWDDLVKSQNQFQKYLQNLPSEEKNEKKIYDLVENIHQIGADFTPIFNEAKSIMLQYRRA